MEQIKDPSICAHNYTAWQFEKKPKRHNGGKIVSSTNGTGKTGC